MRWYGERVHAISHSGWAWDMWCRMRTWCRLLLNEAEYSSCIYTLVEPTAPSLN